MNDARIITLLELFADGLNDKNCHALVFHKSALHPDPEDPDDEEASSSCSIPSSPAPKLANN